MRAESVRKFRFVRLVAALAAAVLAAGCVALGPDFEPPAWDGPDRWTGDVQPPSPLPDGAPWWSVFGDPALDALEEALLAQSPALDAAVARLDVAAAQLGIARADWFPAATLAASSVRERKAAGSDPAEDPAETDWLHSASLSCRWELDFWGRVRRNAEAASADFSAAARDVQAARILLSSQLAETYVSLRTLQAQLACARRNEELQASTLALVRSRFKAGLAGELDLRQAEMNLAATQAGVPELETRLDAALNAICALSGDWPGTREALRDPAPVPVASASSLPDALPADLLRNRPDIAAAIDRLHAETARIGAAKAEMFPKIAIDGSFGFSAVRTSDLFGSGARTWSVGPSVEWPVFAAGRLLRAVRAQEAAVRAAEADFRQAVFDAAAECETALSAHRAALEALAPRQAAVDAAGCAAALAESQYRHGLADFRNVLDMQTRLAEQEDALAQARGAASAALVEVWKAFGGP
jgi:NodT family efflux transporter outer membrane factor (OMF) lipoprotein